eukprot:UN33438
MVECDPVIADVHSAARRYSDFVWLRDMLCSQYPGMFVPPLPPKAMFGNFADEFVEERRLDLERFLNRVEGIHPFCENLAYTMFLQRSDTTLKEGKKSVAAELQRDKAATTTDLANMYPDLHAEELHEEAEQDLVRIKEFFEKTKSQLQAVAKCCDQVQSAYKESKNESLLLHGSLSELYQVEKNYPYRDSPSRLDVAGEFEQWAKFHEAQEKYFKKYIVRNNRYELQDVLAIIEQINR